MRVDIVRLPGNEDLTPPTYNSAGAAGADLAAALPDGPLHLQPGVRTLVPTGFRIALPAGYEAQVRPRSGRAVRDGLGLLNSPGTIDSDYRGEIKVLVINHGQDTVVLQRGDRIAQLVIAPVTRVFFQEVAELPESERGAGGFGHTGK